MEAVAVAAGLAASSAAPIPGNEARRYALRRAIHRIEKGLISRPRRPVFAADYIEEAVDAYGAGVGTCDADAQGRLQTWAHDVLEAYFAAVGSHPAVDRARARFDASPISARDQVDPVRPYTVRTGPLAVTIDDMLEMAVRRRSVRHYLPKPVPREVVDKALVVAGYSPSACNRQPFVFRVFDDPALVRKVASIPMGTAGFYEGFPGVAVIVGQLRAFRNPRDRHLIYIDGSLAAMSFVYGLESQGVSSCCINWPEIAEKEEQMAQALGLAADERPVMLVSFGYADPTAMVPYSQKKPLSELRSYNK